MSKNNLKVEYIETEKLIPYANNAKTHGEADVDAIMASIREFGFTNPIATWKGIICCGHGRLIAAKRLGMEKVPVIALDYLTDEQRKAYILADNRTAELSSWNFDLVAEELGSITGIDMSLFGFDPEAAGIDTAEEIEDDGYAAEPLEEAISRPGELYRLGQHVLMCGDSTRPDDVKRLLLAGGVEQVDLCVTDPPYNVDISNTGGKKIQNDNLDCGAFTEFLKAAFQNIHSALKPGGAFYIWYASRNARNFIAALDDAGLSPREVLIWVKNQLTFGRSDYQWRHEPCLYGWKEGAAHYFCDDRTQTTVFDTVVMSEVSKMTKEQLRQLIKDMMAERDAVPTTVIYEDKPVVNDKHPTMKPIPLIGKITKNSSRRGDVVLDLFGGSGTTLIACEQLGRRCLMMEYDPAYADVIIDRFERFTGEKAVKINGCEAMEKKNKESLRGGRDLPDGL